MEKDTKSKLLNLTRISNINPKSPSSSAALAFSSSNIALGVALKSKTKTFDMPAIRSAIVNSCNTENPAIDKIIAYYPNFKTSSCYFDIKYIVDHCQKTGSEIQLEVYDGQFNCVLDQIISTKFYGDSYNPPNLKYFNQSSRSFSKTKDTHSLVKSCLDLAIISTKNDARYGALFKTKKTFYRSSQYSGLNESSTVHAEIGGLMQVVVNEDFDLSEINLISSKFPDSAPPVCGNCLQIFAELSTYYNLTSAKFNLHSLDGDIVDRYNLEELLPLIWDNRKGERHS